MCRACVNPSLTHPSLHGHPLRVAGIGERAQTAADLKRRGVASPGKRGWDDVSRGMARKSAGEGDMMGTPL